ncbi:MAG TPA: hypothetical protein VLW50_07655 [Streptosporangiaceae bacterium]|nr:hypothetical protein [Streptosporangiaceae bacterium]
MTSIVGAAATILTFGASDAGAAEADAAEAAAILAPEAEAAAAATGTDAAVAADLIAAVDAATSATPDVELAEAQTTDVEQALDEELSQAEDGAAGRMVSDAQKIDNILNPGGQPIGEPGNSPACRLVDDKGQLDQLWDQFQSELGREPRSVGPGGQIQKIDIGNGDYVQYRPFSSTGGATIDVDIANQQISRST